MENERISPSTAGTVEEAVITEQEIIAQNSLIDNINDSFINLFEDRLFPCSIHRVDGKKRVQLPKGWTDWDNAFEDFNDDYNSIALRTGKGIIAVDVDTKDLSLLHPQMKDTIQKLLNDNATFTVETTNGYHFYFESATSYSNAVRISDYVDIRGDGGCVFCYTEDADSSYQVICDEEPLPLTEELIDYISVQKKEHATVDYKYDENNRKIATDLGIENPALRDAYESGEIDRVIKAASSSFTLDMFQAGAEGLYSNVNKLLYILALNPAIPNDDFDNIVEALVEKIGYSMESSETKQRLHQIYSTLVWSNEEDRVEVPRHKIAILDNDIEDDTVDDFPSIFDIPEELAWCQYTFEYALHSEYKTHPTAALATLFAIASSVTARTHYAHTKAPSTLFTILIAPTGSGKNILIKTPDAVLRSIGLEERIITSKISSEGAMDDVFKEQAIVTHILDEFGDQLWQMLSDKGGYLKAVATKMKNLYSLSMGVYKSTRYSSSGGKNQTEEPWTLQRPCYSLFGATTKVQLLSRLSSDMLHDGFLNRFIILDGSGVEPYFPEEDYITHTPPDELIEHLLSLKERAKSYRYDIATVGLSNKAKEYYYKFIGDADIKGTDIYNYCVDDDTEINRAISVRWRENALRLAVALTAYEGLEEISLSVLQYCYRLVKESSIAFIKSFDKESNQTKYEKLKEKAIEWFKKQGSAKFFPLSYLAKSARPFSSLKSKERKELLDDLVESEILELKVNRKNKKEEKLYSLK